MGVGALCDGWVLDPMHDVLWVRCRRAVGSGGAVAAGDVVTRGLACGWVREQRGVLGGARGDAQDGGG